MKSGIFKRQDNGKHIYVRKDRTIGAIELSDVHPCESEYKVSERAGGKYVNVPDPNGEYFVTVAERVADAPRGVSDCCRALGEYVDSLKGPPQEAEAADDENFSLKVDDAPSQAEGTREIGDVHHTAHVLTQDPELDAYHGGQAFVGVDDKTEEFMQRNPGFAEAYDQAQPRRTLAMDIEAGPPGTIYFSDGPLHFGGVLTKVGEVGAFGRGTEEVRPADQVPASVPLSRTGTVTVNLDVPEDIYKRFADAIYNGQAHAERLLAMPRALGAGYGVDAGGEAPPIVVPTSDAEILATLSNKESVHGRMSGAPVEFDLIEKPRYSCAEQGKRAHEEIFQAYADLAEGKFRLCHAASARKHKKKRDRRVWWHPVFQQYAWAKVTA